MDLLERYLQAVGQYLQASSREDTLAELRANLLAEMDGRAEELNRPLSENEVAGVLRAHGKPQAVALRYLPQRSLIGPAIFPFYLLTMRRTLPIVVLLYAIAEGIGIVTAPSGGAVATRIVQSLFGLIPALLSFWAVVTIVFATIDFARSHNAAEKKTEDWDPAKLPPLTHAKAATQRSFASRAVDLGVHCLWMLYVLAVPSHPYLLIGPGENYLLAAGIRFAPVWHVFYVLLIVLLAVQLGMKLLALTPGVHAWSKPLEFATNLLGVVAISIMACAGEYFVPVSPTANLTRLAHVNHAMSLSFRIALLFAALGLLTEVWKWVQRKLPVERLAF